MRLLLPPMLPSDARDSVGLLEVVVEPERAAKPRAAVEAGLTKAVVSGSLLSLRVER